MTKTMPLRAILSTSALAAMSFAALPAHAACVDGGATLTCTGTGNAAITDATEDKSFTIEPDAAVGPLSGIAMTLSGDDQSVLNQGLIESLDDEAVRTTGARLTFDNAGEIRATDDRGIRLQAGADDATIINRAGATILTKDQAIRADSGDVLENLRVENDGTITSTDGRAIQSRGPGTTVINTGIIEGGEEVIEARTDFTLENRGTIKIGDPAIADEDGVQFASGRVDNFGLIQGSDDGIDVDEGTIVNHAGGEIRVVPAPLQPGGNGIDADEETQDPVNGDRPAGLLTIENAGLIEGPKAIAVDDDRTAAVNVINSGTLRGISGVAMDLAPAMDASALEIFDGSMIFGDVLLTDSDDTVTIGALTSGQMVDTFFEGHGGDDTVFLDSYDLTDIVAFGVNGTEASLTLATLAGDVTGEFFNFETWNVGGTRYTTSGLAAAVAPIPLPAGLPLLGAGLAGLWALRRHRAA